MGYSSLKECIEDLEKNGMLIRIKEEVDPDLEMAAIHLKMFARRADLEEAKQVSNAALAQKVQRE